MAHHLDLRAHRDTLWLVGGFHCRELLGGPFEFVLAIPFMHRWKFFGSLFSLLAIAVGCGGPPKTYVVHGTVVFPDGQPLTRGTVEFEALGQPKPITASGEIANDGTFQLGTFAANDGAIAGEHRVAVISDYQIGTGVERPGELPPLQLDPKFASFKTSGLKFTIKPRMNNILIEVDYATPEVGK